jgi:cysteine-rich repeat protein
MAMLHLAAASNGCIGSDSVECSFGGFCVSPSKCDEIHKECVLPVQLTVCVGLADGAPCSVAGDDGFVCDQEICTRSTCGDGILDPRLEQCDDGNTVNGDGCQANCISTSCGDGSLDPGEECDDGNDVDWDGCTSACRIAEFQVNRVFDGSQRGPKVASGADGRFIVVWKGPDGADDGIYGRFFDEHGVGAPGEIKISGDEAGTKDAPSVAMAPDGRAVVVWESYGDETTKGIWRRLVHASGSNNGATTQVVAGNAQNPSVAMDSTGRFVAVWDNGDPETTGPGANVLAQLFSADGNALADSFQVNTYITSYQTRPHVAGEPGGRFVVAWESNEQLGVENSYDIFAQRFNMDGSPAGSEFGVNSPITGGQRYARVSMNSAGKFTVAFESGDGEGYGTAVRRFDENGSSIGDQLQPNDYTEGDQRLPVVALADTDSFLVVWYSVGQDGSEAGVFGKCFNQGGEGGSEIRLNDFTDGNQFYAAVAFLPSVNHYVVVWESSVQDGSQQGIFAKRVNLDCSPVAVGP